METVTDFFLGTPKALQMVTAAMRLKDAYSLEENLWPKFWLVKAMIFSVVMYGYESWIIKKAECGRIDAFVLRY